MIHLTRLNKHPIGVNADLIKFIENVPDTMITLLTGEKLLVLESFEVILDRIVAYRQRVLSGLDIQDYIANAKGPEVVSLLGAKKNKLPAATFDEPPEKPETEPSDGSETHEESR